MALDPLTAGLSLGEKIFGIIDKFIPDKTKAAEAKAAFEQAELAGEINLSLKAGDIVKAEAESEHWLAACWRPITMLTFTFIILNNYVLYPYLGKVGAKLLDLPDQFWSLLQIGLGGYIGLRSAEKIATTIGGSKVDIPSALKKVLTKEK